MLPNGGVLDLVTRETGLTEKARSDWMHEHGFDVDQDHHARPPSKTNGNGQLHIVKTYDLETFKMGWAKHHPFGERLAAMRLDKTFGFCPGQKCLF